MPQQGSHGHQVGACIQGVLGKAVPEGMGRDPLEPGQAGVLGDQAQNRVGLEPLAPLTDKEGIGRDGGPDLEILSQSPPGINIQGQDPVLRALVRPDDQGALPL